MEEKNSEKKERKMRDSGIPWIGEVPEKWKVMKIGHCFRLKNEKIFYQKTRCSYYLFIQELVCFLQTAKKQKQAEIMRRQ